MLKYERTPEQIREHYEIEKALANQLRVASQTERRTLYSSLYDELYRTVPHHPQLIRKANPEKNKDIVAYQMRNLGAFLKADTTFLEVGPGDCSLSITVAKQVKEVYAVDVSAEIAHQKTFPDNLKLILSDGVSVPVPSNSVDFAYSNQLMEHLHPDDALEQLKNIYQSLAPGGRYLCITPNRLLGPHDISQHFDQVATGFHLKEYTVTELTKLFRDVGFKKIRAYFRIKRFYFYPYPIISSMAEAFLTVLPFPLRKPFARFIPIGFFTGVFLLGTK